MPAFLPADFTTADLYKETSLWEVGSFDANGRNNTTGNASFWLSLYGITTVRLGNSAEGIENETQTTDGSWSKVANGLTLSLPPAQGWAVYGRSASGSPAAVRLPKEDDLYYYFNKYGEQLDGQYEQNLQALRETNAVAQGGHAGELAFHPSGAFENYTLVKDADAGSQTFVFGNPTMGYIDIQTPEQSHEVRYYIRRRGFNPQSSTDEPIVTGFEWIETEGNKAVKFINQKPVVPVGEPLILLLFALLFIVYKRRIAS